VAEYDRSIATATRLILKKGRPVELIPPAGLANALKPWLGRTAGAGIPATAAFTKDERGGESAERRTGECLLAADPDYAPELDWKLADGGSTWNITAVNVVAPGLQTVIYKLQVDQ